MNLTEAQPNMSRNETPEERSDRDQPTAAPRSSGPRPRDARQARFAQAFANIVAVLMRDPGFRNMKLRDLEWLVLPPIMAGQWRLAQSQPPVPGGDPRKKEASTLLVPMAVALWARVSPEIDRRLSANLDKPMVLQPNEWASGDHIWLVATAGDPRVVPSFLRQLRDTEFKGQQIKLRSRGADGKPAIGLLHALPLPAA